MPDKPLFPIINTDSIRKEALAPLLGNMMSDMFWFVSYHFTIMPIIAIIPVFLLLGWLIPAVLYHADKEQSIVENLREL